ncbi:MAG: hypothetical protein JSU96_03935 [Acidobacteriota bacterium]|nr:MAG: hypothetical protein JSU96_03935 [Acidobacteriota bacterium]
MFVVGNLSMVLANQQRENEALQPMVDGKYGSAAEIMALAPAQLVEILEDSDATLFAKSRACLRLAVVGGKDEVPALAILLEDSQLSHYARFALEAIPDQAVDEALREALGKVEGKLLAGVINSIGRRKDVDALPLLGKFLHSEDAEVSQSAAEAMRRIRPAFY